MGSEKPHPATPYWPLFGLALRTERLELRYPSDEDCVQLAELAAKGIHDPNWMPFQMPWTREPSPRLERNALQFYWRTRALWSPQDWSCILVTRHEGEVIGTQDLMGKDFGVARVVRTGSWLGQRYQGKGFGKEQRAAVLHLIFEGLRATRAESGAWEDNGPSLGVSRSLGYEESGDEIQSSDDKPRRMIGLKLTRERWEAHRKHEVEISGLEPCLELFGADGSTSPDRAG